MKLVFAGTPAFAVASLDALHAAGHDIVAVFTQPDRPAGRGRKLRASPVAERAGALALAIEKPAKLDAAAQAQLRALAPDAMIVVAYGLLLPQAVLDIPRLGCLNVHASLLPRWRGAAPIARAIEAGDRETGVCIMRMDAGLDTGPVLARAAWPIPATATAADAHAALAALGARVLTDTLPALAAGQIVAHPQPTEGACYAHKLSKAEARLEWTQPAEQLARRVRAFNPAPVAWSMLDGERVRIWNACNQPDDTVHAGTVRPAAGTVIAVTPAGMDVATGAGTLRLLTLQRPGGRALSAAQFSPHWNPVGHRFD